MCEKDANNLRRILLARAAIAVVYATVVDLYEFIFSVGYGSLELEVCSLNDLESVTSYEG